MTITPGLAQAAAQLHTVADTIGLVVSLPLLGTCILGVRYIDAIRHTAEDTNKSLMAFMGSVTANHVDHEDRLREQEAKMAVVWDGHERRVRRAGE